MGGPCDTRGGSDGGGGGGAPATGSASRAPPVRLSTTPAAAVDDARGADRTSPPPAPPFLPVVAAGFSATGGVVGRSMGRHHRRRSPPPLRPRTGLASAPSRAQHVLGDCVAGWPLPTPCCCIVCRRPDFDSLWRAATTPVRSRCRASSQRGGPSPSTPPNPGGPPVLAENGMGGRKGGRQVSSKEGWEAGGCTLGGERRPPAAGIAGLAPRTAAAATAAAAAAVAVTAASGAAARPWQSATGRRPPLLVGGDGPPGSGMPVGRVTHSGAGGTAATAASQIGWARGRPHPHVGGLLLLVGYPTRMRVGLWSPSSGRRPKPPRTLTERRPSVVVGD